MTVATPPAKPAPAESAAPRLTELARFAGCAAKISQADLHQALAGLPVASDPRVLVGHDTSDDAAVIKLRDDLALVETVDIFPPIVDDPYDFGRIAATNALSDIYAMGGTPLNALSFVAWPVDTLGTGSLRRVLDGAAAICAEAGIAISGGHSIVDEEPKFGLFVTGTIDPRKVVSNAGARPGDVLVLTKPIGTGVLTTAVKRNAAPERALAAAIASMTTLNRHAAEAMTTAGAAAATDITGFGLLGHLGNMLRASSTAAGTAIGARLSYAAVPVFERVTGFLKDGLCPGGTKRNLEYAAPQARFADSLAEPQRLLLADAQTSGGLLIAVAPEKVDALVADLRRRGTPAAAVIGSIVAADRAGVIEVTA
ncbi:selenide, water dikinase SelD [Reyranella sp.]|uniref:selenide, water dikinase SelD n=1 Tax=Reyranella sp. TaxID=1929291 RepID=UPI003BA87657